MSMDVQIGQDILDTRDLEERILELQDEEELYEDEEETLTALLAARDEISEWWHGETLIHERYFKTYAQDLAEDIGAIQPEAQWPYTCIDWDWAVRELLMDYGSVELLGHTYYVRY